MSRLARLLLLVLVVTGVAHAQFTIPQRGGIAGPPPVAPGITAGDGIVCEFSFDGSLSFVSLTDSLNSGTFTRANSTDLLFGGATGQSVVAIYYFPNTIHGSSDTITLTTSGTAQDFSNMACQAYKNIKTVASTDSGTNNPGNTAIAGTTGTNPASGNFQTTVNGDLLISYLVNANSTPSTGATGTVVDGITVEGTFPQYFVQSTASSSSQMNYTAASDKWAMLWASFQNNGSTITLDGSCHNSADNGTSASNTVVVTISC